MAAVDEARAALQASVAINAGHQALTEESRLLLTAILRGEMREGLGRGRPRPDVIALRAPV